MDEMNQSFGVLLGMLPLFVISAGGLILLLLESTKRPYSSFLVTVSSIVLALVSLSTFGVWAGYAGLYGSDAVFLPHDVIRVDGMGFFFTAAILFCGFLAVLSSERQITEDGVEQRGAYYFLLLMSLCGGMILVTAGELCTLFIGLELMSLSFYCMCGAAPAKRRASEAALKYFILGSVSSAIFLYGAALMYGSYGTTRIAEITPLLWNGAEPLARIGIGLILVSLAFKVGLVPFHFGIPDPYTGSVGPTVTMLGSVGKLAAVGAFARIVVTYEGQFESVIVPLIWLVGVLSVTVGNLAALRQRSMRRLLAYSSIAHAGYMMMALVAGSIGLSSLLFYAATYAVVFVGASAITNEVAARRPDDRYADDLSHFRGLAHSSPMLAVAMGVFLFALAGLPPGFVGLVGKLYLFRSALSVGCVGFVVIAALTSAIGCYYYLRVLTTMFVKSSEEATALPRSAGFAFATAVTVCCLLVLVGGLFPERLLGLTVEAGISLH